MSSSRVRGLVLGLSIALFSVPAGAAERLPFEKSKGWEIERTVGNTGPNPCLMSRSYKDKDDDNAENAIIFALNGDQAVLVLGYENWTWDKDEKVKVPFALGKKTINAKSAWVGDGKLLTTTFPETVVPDLLAAKTIVLRFDDSDADFDIAGFPQAYESLRRCDIAKPQVAAAPVVPPEARMKTYMLGLMVQQVIRDCDVSTTSKQRAAVDAKIAALAPEMTAVEAALREGVEKRPGPHCPPAGDEPKFQTTLRDLIDKTPEEFAATLDKREGEEKAAQGESKQAAP